MAYPKRDWWVNTYRRSLWLDKPWMLYLQLDYDSLNLSVMLGWFGFRLYYLATQYSDMTIASGASFSWKPREIREIISGYPTFHKSRGFHKVNDSVWAMQIRNFKGEA